MQADLNQQLEKRLLQKYESGLRLTIETIMNDSLMECFKESQESKIFMLDRMREIMNSCLADILSNLQQEVYSELKLRTCGLEEAAKRLQELTAQRNSLDEENLKLQRELSTLITKNEEELDTLKCRVHDLEQENNSLSKMQSELEKEKLERDSKENILMRDHKEKNLNLSHKINQLKDQLDKKDSKIHNLNQELSFKISEINQLKKCPKESDQLKNTLQKINEENQELEKRVLELNSQLETASHHKISTLQKAKSGLTEELSELENQIEEKDFSIEQLQQTIEKLKQDINSLTIRINEERKEKNEIEISSIEVKEKNSDLLLENSSLKENYEELKEKTQFLEIKYSKINEEFKTERRQAASARRQLEELRFSTGNVMEDNRQELVILKEKNGVLQKENLSLGQRLEQILHSNQGRNDTSRKELLVLQEKLRDNEQKNDRLQLEIENLKKSVEFFKEKSSAAQKKNLESECKNSRSIKKQKQHSNTMYESLVSEMAVRLKHLRNEYECEKLQLKSDLNFYKKSIMGLFKTLAASFKEQSLCNKHAESEMDKLRKDVIYFRRLNEEFTNRQKLARRDDSCSLNFSRNFISNSSIANEENLRIALRRSPLIDRSEEKLRLGMRRSPLQERRPIVRASEEKTVACRNFESTEIDPKSLKLDLGGDINLELLERESQEIERRISMLKRSSGEKENSFFQGRNLASSFARLTTGKKRGTYARR